MDLELAPPWTGRAFRRFLGLPPSDTSVVRLDGAQVVRLDAALAVLGGRRERSGAAWRLVPGDRPPGAAAVGTPALLEEVLGEIEATLDGLGPEAGAAAIAAMPGAVLTRAWTRVRGAAEPPRAGLRTERRPADVQRLGHAVPYAGFFAVETHRLRHRRFAGGMSAALDRAVFTSADAATVLPWDPACDRVLMIEQFRPGPMARRDALPWCLEAIAGRCDNGEAPEATVRREAREEAGIALGRLARIAGYYPSPGLSSEHITAFVGEARLDGGEAGLYGCAGEDEDIRAFVLPRETAMAALEAGEVNNAPLMISLMWLALHRDRLAREWAAPA
jgi:ADP-ribose pyrophosphatase